MENYHKLPNKSKGDVGELIVSELMKKVCITITSDLYGYDTEIKIV